ncbi:LLM class flavin-dependent oxidoreductase [Actinoplanes sp. NPDC049265]|uniref:LLM class flavin-dependent oxidoreductase n=1 Tax=Actinoplanes sp. NPDC049265 TaxID=3363902 RepID=UPI0037235AA5
MNPAVIPGWAKRAEEAGFSTLGTVGRLAYPGLNDTVALAAAAGATSRIGLLTNVLLATVWPPVLLAKEAAGIDAVSGGRLTLGLGIGARPDDFVAEGYPAKGLGKRIDADLEVYHRVWKGEPVGGGDNAAVPTGTRAVPLLFGGMAPASFARLAKWGQGWVAPSVPVAMAAQGFEAARGAWKAAGREGDPRMVGIAYVALGDPEKGKANVYDYYSISPQFLDIVMSSVSTSADQLRETVKAFAALGIDELILNPTTDDPDEVERFAEVVLS